VSGDGGRFLEARLQAGALMKGGGGKARRVFGQKEIFDMYCMLGLGSSCACGCCDMHASSPTPRETVFVRRKNPFSASLLHLPDRSCPHYFQIPSRQKQNLYYVNFLYFFNVYRLLSI